ncbi:hypothetical protein LWI28_022891 [Acer negundo]|uniref:Uncharacterized protein n=1 Tax=Acer negundo TaxID=4023 RepID=A0AAD5INR7_ACENE|nr:hypothetical protein LWI28_022891 [Acer negundo]
MDECVVEVDEEKNVSFEASRNLAVWLRASSPPKRSFRGQEIFDRGQGDRRLVFNENRRSTENWRGKRVVFTSEVIGGFHDLRPPQIKEKEVSSQAMGRAEGMVPEMENVTRLARGVHGVMGKSGALIIPAPDEGMVEPTDICKALGQVSGPSVGLSEEISLGGLGSSHAGLGDSPVLNDSKTSIHDPTNLVTNFPSYGPELINNDIGREESTSEIVGDESGKRKFDEKQDEECKGSRKLSSQSFEDRRNIADVSQADSQLLDGEDEEDRFGGGSISSAVNLLFFFSLGGGGWRQRGRSIDGFGLGFDRSMVMFLGLMMLVQI